MTQRKRTLARPSRLHGPVWDSWYVGASSKAKRRYLMLQTLRLLRYATLLLAVTACSGPAPLKWEESVVLPDGRIVVLKREQHFD